MTENQSGEINGPENESGTDADSEEAETVAEAPNILNQLESEDTRPLTNEQLQRIILLKQIDILDLQKQKLTNEVNNSGPLLLDISGLNVSSILNTDDQ